MTLVPEACPANLLATASPVATQAAYWRDWPPSARVKLPAAILLPPGLGPGPNSGRIRREACVQRAIRVEAHDRADSGISNSAKEEAADQDTAIGLQRHCARHVAELRIGEIAVEGARRCEACGVGARGGACVLEV